MTLKWKQSFAAINHQSAVQKLFVFVFTKQQQQQKTTFFSPQTIIQFEKQHV
jgi:hypothetical protein